MNSSRLPGKVLKELAGKPVLQWLIEGLSQVQKTDVLIVATSRQAENKAIVDFCTHHKVPSYQGSEENVLSRYAAVANEYKLDHIVRCTGDNPLHNAIEIDHLIDHHLKSGADYSSNIDSLPKGIGSEIFRSSTLIQLNSYCTEPDDLEHVNEYIIKNPKQFSIHRVTAKQKQFNECHLSFSIDTMEEFSWMEKFFKILPSSEQTHGNIAQIAQTFVN